MSEHELLPRTPRGDLTDHPSEQPRTEAALDDARAVKILTNHQRRDAGSCICGWSKWGASFAEHQWRMLQILIEGRTDR